MLEGHLSFSPSDTETAATYVIRRLRTALGTDTEACVAERLGAILAAGNPREHDAVELGEILMRLHEARLLLTENTDQDDDGG